MTSDPPPDDVRPPRWRQTPPRTLRPPRTPPRWRQTPPGPTPPMTSDPPRWRQTPPPRWRQTPPRTLRPPRIRPPRIDPPRICMSKHVYIPIYRLCTCIRHVYYTTCILYEYIGNWHSRFYYSTNSNLLSIFIYNVSSSQQRRRWRWQQQPHSFSRGRLAGTRRQRQRQQRRTRRLSTSASICSSRTHSSTMGTTRLHLSTKSTSSWWRESKLNLNHSLWHSHFIPLCLKLKCFLLKLEPCCTKYIEELGRLGSEMDLWWQPPRGGSGFKLMATLKIL